MGIPPQTFDVTGKVPLVVSVAPLVEAVTVLNMSTTAEVYLSAEPGNTGFPLSPGSTMTWDSGQSLYVTTETATVSRIGVVYNSGQIIDSRALAAQIVASGLGDEIAEKISLTGVPTIDRPTVIAGDSESGSPIGVLSGSGDSIWLTGGGTSAYVDVTGYSTMVIQLAAIVGLTSTRFTYRIKVTHALVPVPVYGGTGDNYTVTDGEALLTVPLKGNYVRISIEQLSGSAGTEIYGSIYVSYRESISHVECDPADVGGDTVSHAEGSVFRLDVDVPPTTRISYYPWWKSARFILGWGFQTDSAATANTNGVAVGMGVVQNTGYSTQLNRGLIAGTSNSTSKTLDLNTYEGFLAQDYPILTIINRNTVVAPLNITVQYEH